MIVDTRVSVHGYPACDQGLIRRLRRAIDAILNVDQRWRTEKAGFKIETLLVLDPPPPQGRMYIGGHVDDC